MRYRVVIETPVHGVLFRADCDQAAIREVLLAAVSALAAVEADLLARRIPVDVKVEAYT